jgi:organic radical activating enzyme
VVPPNPAQMLDLQMSALSILDDVRVIPQTHKLTGQL